MSSEVKHDPYGALRFRDFRLLVIGRFVATMGDQMLSVAVGWQLYARTHSALALGIVGLVQVLPVILLFLQAGQVADQFNRKKVIMASLGGNIIWASCLAVLAAANGPVILIYVVLFGIGIGDAFYRPSSSSFISQVVPDGQFANAATWSSSAWQLASVIGPALGGLVIALENGGTTIVYILEALATLLFLILMFMIQAEHQPVKIKRAQTMASLVEGVTYVRENKVILAAITLDLFAVLLGGAVSLLPIYATDVLHVGPVGLGWMRAMPSIGAVIMAIMLAHLPPFKRAGKVLLWAVATFGIATVIFGVSKIFALSLIMLFIMGASDSISVVIRSTLMLVRTPDSMRGRVSAVNNLFIGMSNQLGGFESGLTAAIFGPILSVAGGGIGTVLVVTGVAFIWPQLREMGKLEEVISDK